jgi:WD40 repeat protein
MLLRIRSRSAWLAGAALGLALLAVVWLRTGNTHASGRAMSPAAPLSLLWSRPIADFRGAALSPQGELVALSSGTKGTVSLWHWRTQPDKPLWTHAAANASNVAVGAAGATVLAWAALDPDQPEITILNGADGSTLAHQTLSGAVWDADISADGTYAGVVTGGKTLYLYGLSDQPYRDERHDKRIHSWSLGGIGSSVAFPTLGSFLVTGTWNDSSVACYTPRGVCLWQYPENPAARQELADRLFTAQISGNGSYVLGMSYGNVRQCDPSLYLWRSDGGGNPLWKAELGEDAFYPAAQITQNGDYIAVSYLRQVVRGAQSLSEHHLRLLDRDGNTLWERGDLLFSPTLIALSPDGSHILVSDGQHTLYALRHDGHILRRYPLPGSLRQTSLSADGRVLLVYTSDGTLSLYQLG